MVNARLNEAIKAAGGPVAVAYKLDMSVANVYRWRAAGRVFDAQDTVLLQRLAAEGGCHVSFEELAGVGLAVNGGPKNGKSREGGRMRTTVSFPRPSAHHRPVDGSVPTARARLVGSHVANARF